MTGWTIYDKSGSERKVQWLDSTEESASHFTQPTLEYNGTWMGESFVTLNVRCSAPVDFEIGDYLLYRGEKFVINYDPTVIKKARRETYGEGFTYDGIKFNSLSNELTDIRFLDYVLADNNIHYSSLPKFPFYAASIEDYCDRLQANTNRYCTDNGFALDDYWLFVTPDRSRTIQRSSYLRKNGNTWEGMSSAEVNARWNAVFGEWSYTYGGTTISGGGSDLSEEKTDVSLTIDNMTVWNALSYIKSDFGLNFTIRGRSVNVGVAGYPVNHLFKYGKGNGLYEIERTADTEQQIITKLYAYGSDTNLPARYYANLNMSIYGTVTAISGSTVDLDIAWRTDYFTGTYDESNSGYRVTVSIDDASYSAYCYQKYNSSVVSVAGIGADLSTLLSVSDKLYFTGGIDIDKWPSSSREYGTDNLPNNMAINVLMLPGFPNQSLYAWVKSNGGTNCNDTTGLATWRGYTAYFSLDPYQPYILSQNYPTLGIREACKYWDGSDGEDAIYPTIEGTGFDVITSADVIQDNGIYNDGDNVSGFDIILPDFGSGFDLKELMRQTTETATISMKDGYCGGRDFEIASAEQNGNGTWTCSCKRTHDDVLDLWFPYSYNMSIGGSATSNEPYQIRTGDKYVLTGIPMTDTYVVANAVKLLEAALEFLSKNDYTRYTYSPRVDEIFMARQHDYAVANSETSMHDVIKEGDIMLFEDDDLNIDGSIFIDSLTIKEYGNAQIPTYDITLRDEKQVGTIEKIQNQINVLTSSTNNAVGTPAIRKLIEAYGGDLFLSKKKADTGEGRITFVRGIEASQSSSMTGIENTGSITNSGNLNQYGNVVVGNPSGQSSSVTPYTKSANFNSGLQGWFIDNLGNMELESLTVRSFLEVTELLINRLQAQEGDTIFTDNDQIESISIHVDTDETEIYTLTLKEKWEGYFTSQQYGNIIKGIINTLAASYEGVSDVTEEECVEVDGNNKYYTSWMRVVADRNTDPTLETNQIRVVLYGDNEVPAQKNFPPCPLMTIGRWGCIDYAEEDDTATLASIEKRQRLFYISVTDGRIMKLRGVNKPILEQWNYGTTLGVIPDFMWQWRAVAEKALPTRDYLYAQGVIVQSIIEVYPDGQPKGKYIDRGEWQDNTEYLCYEFNETSGDWETHDVWHNLCKWRCLQHQPVTIGGVQTYFEPKWSSSYWQMIEGNDNLSIEFLSSNGTAFRVGYVNTTITPYLYYGSLDISADLAAANWSWKRETESGETAADRSWNANHIGVRALTLTNSDMPIAWSRSNRAIFTCTAVINDGSTETIIQNQVIA